MASSAEGGSWGSRPPSAISPSLSLRQSSCCGQDRIRGFSKSGSKCVFRHILAQSLFFKTPYVWDDRRPRPRVKERSPCRAVSHVHEWRLDAASDGRITAVLPV